MCKFVSLVLLTSVIAAPGCNDDKKPRPAPMPPETAAARTAAIPAPPQSASAPAPPDAEIRIASVGNTMTYDTTTLTVAAGQTVHLTLRNNSTMDVLPHNWVLAAQGGDPAAIAAAGLKLGPDAAYVDARDKSVLAHTPLAKAGQSVEVTFTAPAAPGTYPYFCTCPGHYMMMKGKLVVT